MFSQVSPLALLIIFDSHDGDFDDNEDDYICVLPIIFDGIMEIDFCTVLIGKIFKVTSYETSLRPDICGINAGNNQF